MRYMELNHVLLGMNQLYYHYTISQVFTWICTKSIPFAEGICYCYTMKTILFSKKSTQKILFFEKSTQKTLLKLNYRKNFLKVSQKTLIKTRSYPEMNWNFLLTMQVCYHYHHKTNYVIWISWHLSIFIISSK